MKYSGFTLIELLIAIAIFSILSLAAQRLLSTMAQVSRSLDKIEADLDVIQRAVLVMEKDTLQIVARPIRNQSGEQEPAIELKDNMLVFTRCGWRNVLNEDRSALQRVGYRLEKGQLIRYYWPVLDRAPDTPKRRQVLIDKNVESLRWRFLNNKNVWVNKWPSGLSSSYGQSSFGGMEKKQEVDPFYALPKAIEITLEHEKKTLQIISPLPTYVKKNVVNDTKEKTTPRGWNYGM